MREKLPPRRMGVTERLTFRRGQPGEVMFDVTYGYEIDGPVKEVFCLAFRIGTDRHQELHQACIAISIALQSGQSMADIARVMGEDNPDNPPHSTIGLIVRAGVMVDTRRAGEIAMLRVARACGAESLIDQLHRIEPKEKLNDLEMDDGIGVEDLAPEDGGVLRAMAECQDVALPVGILDRIPPAQINGMAFGGPLQLVPAEPVCVDLAREIPEFLRRTAATERQQ